MDTINAQDVVEVFRGENTVRVLRDRTTPTNYVFGRGVDSVPSKVGTEKLKIDDGRESTDDEVVLVLNGVSDAVRTIVQLRIAEGCEVTKERMLKILQDEEYNDAALLF